jgi:putative Holliday junction resolvase
VDLGERRIGVAVGDAVTGEVRPLATLRRLDSAADAIALRRLADEQGATELVVGLPLLADGSEGTQAGITRAWATEVQPRLGLPVAWRDERHTSQNAESKLGPARRGRSGGPPSPSARRSYRARVDREAAASIVQAELDARSSATQAAQAAARTDSVAASKVRGLA